MPSELSVPAVSDRLGAPRLAPDPATRVSVPTGDQLETSATKKPPRLWHAERTLPLNDGLDPGLDRGEKPRPVATFLGSILDQIDAIGGIESQGSLYLAILAEKASDGAEGRDGAPVRVPNSV